MSARKVVFEAVEKISGVEVEENTPLVDSLPNMQSLGFAKVAGHLLENGYGELSWGELSYDDVKTVGSFADWVEKHV